MSTEDQVEARSTAEYLAKHPVFELSHMAKELGLSGGLSRAHDRSKHHLAQGRLIRVARGIYATVPPGAEASSFVPDKFLVACAARPDAVFCYHSALELHGVAQSHWSDCTVFTAKRRSPVSVGAGEVQFLTVPSPLASSHGSFAETSVHRLGEPLRVTSPERTLIEGFRKPDRAGGLEEHVASVSGFGVLDLELLLKVLKRYSERRLWSAVGWFLELRQRQYFVPDDYLKQLEAHVSNSPHYLARGDRGGSLVARWSLIVPSSLSAGMEGDRA